MDLYDFGTKHGEVMSADALNKLEDITNGLDWKELDSLGLLLRQNGSPPSGQLSKERGEGTYLFAHDLLAGLGDDLAKLIGKAGGEAQKARVSSSITTRFKQAFPRLYFTNQLEMGTKYSAENRASVAAFLIGDGRAMDETDALGLIDAALVAGRASNADSIAIGDRTYWTEKGYNKMDLDPTESLQLFFTEAFKEAAMGASFDKNYVKLKIGRAHV